MKNRTWIWLAVLLLMLAALVAWQWDEYVRECRQAQQTVASSADSVMNALVGGILSHRRLGLFFSEQLQGALDGMLNSREIRAAAVVSEDGKTVLSAGKRNLLDLEAPLTEGESWNSTGYRLVRKFRLPTETAGPGGGPGGGFGGGRGWGRRWQMEAESSPNTFAPGTQAAAILVVDRSRADIAYRHAAWTRGAIVVAGWLVVLCLAFAWRATVRLTEARGRARALEIEASHLRELSQAAAGLAHETRNPLGLIRGWTQRLAETGIESCEARRQTQAVVEECDRVTARINQFLAFARPSEPRPQRFDPALLTAELAMLLEPDLSAKRLVLRGLAPGHTIVADREMLRQALFNLLQNAIQASPELETVEIWLERGRDGHWRIEVADRGPGVNDGAVDKLFTPYFTTRTDGTGLGLAIVRRLATVHGWEVGYRPRPDCGSIFWMDGIHD